MLVSSIEERKLAANKTEKHRHIYLNNAESGVYCQASGKSEVEYIGRLQLAFRNIMNNVKSS